MRNLKSIALFISIAIVSSCSGKNEGEIHSLSNKFLEVDVLHDLSIHVLDKRNNKEYKLSDLKDFELQNVESGKVSCLLHCLYLPDSIFVTASVSFLV